VNHILLITVYALYSAFIWNLSQDTNTTLLFQVPTVHSANKLSCNIELVEALSEFRATFLVIWISPTGSVARLTLDWLHITKTLDAHNYCTGMYCSIKSTCQRTSLVGRCCKTLTPIGTLTVVPSATGDTLFVAQETLKTACNWQNALLTLCQCRCQRRSCPRYLGRLL